MDFGLCRPTEASAGHTPDFWFAHGDPDCAAPERLFHLESAEVGDAYSVGCILYALCTRQIVVPVERAFFSSIRSTPDRWSSSFELV